MATVIERYPAVVTVNDDPDKLGRIKVKCSGILGDEEGELPMWVLPCLDWGMFFVPDVDEQVEVEMVVSTDQDEARGQASLEEADLRWRGKRFYAPGADVPTVIHEEFKTNYGKRRGFCTPMGHVLYFDDTEGKTEITLGWVDADGVKSRLTIDKEGSVKLSSLDEKHLFILNGKTKSLTVSLDEEKHAMTLDGENKNFAITLDSEKHKIMLDGSGNEMTASVNNEVGKLSLTGDTFEVDLASGAHVFKLESSAVSAKLGSQDAIKVEGASAAAVATVGSGADNAVAYTPFNTVWSTVMGLIAAHTHIVATTGTAAAQTGTAAAAVSLATIATVPPLTAAKSNHLKIPLG